jgi:hypothetical protein
MFYIKILDNKIKFRYNFGIKTNKTKGKTMNKNYTYCNTKNCYKRRECKKWIGNYNTEEVEVYRSYFNDVDCIMKQNYLFEPKTEDKVKVEAKTEDKVFKDVSLSDETINEITEMFEEILETL